MVAAQAELADTHGGDSRALGCASLFYFVAGVVAESLGVTQAQRVPRGR